MKSKFPALAICIPLIAACVETTQTTTQKAAPNKTGAVVWRPAQSFVDAVLHTLPVPKEGGAITKRIKTSHDYTFVLSRSNGVQEETAKAQIVSICLNVLKGSFEQAEKQILSNKDLGLFIDCKT